MIRLRHISPGELTPPEILELAKAEVRAYDNPAGDTIIQLALADRLRIFRIEGDMTGLVGLEIHVRPAGDELWISFVSGKGALKFIKEIHDAIAEIGRSLGARSLATMAKGEALVSIYARHLSLRPHSVLFREELK